MFSFVSQTVPQHLKITPLAGEQAATGEGRRTSGWKTSTAVSAAVSAAVPAAELLCGNTCLV